MNKLQEKPKCGIIISVYFFEGDFLLALWIVIGAVAVLAAAMLITAFVCYRITFYAKPRRPHDPEYIPTPNGEIYDPYRDRMREWVLEARELCPQEFSIKSFDGLTLYAKYYEYEPGAPIELMFHGYRGNAESDLSGGVQRCRALGRSSFIVDQRCSGKSDGKTISFGINEYRDCLSWVDFMVEHFGPDVKIILTGISMGASTVLLASGEEMPKNVVGVLADCGYSSAEAIIKKVMRDMKLPPNIAYPFVKFGAKIFGGFNLDETSPIDAVKHATVPIILYHGEADAFVPCDMAKELLQAISTRKQLVTVKDAGHGLSYIMDSENYINTLREFFAEELK